MMYFEDNPAVLFIGLQDSLHMSNTLSADWHTDLDRLSVWFTWPRLC